MTKIVGHFWMRGANGALILYEADYSSYPIRDGVLCYRMVLHSERPCTCPERECHERHLIAVLN